MESLISTKRRIFKEDPAKRFSRVFNKSPDFWRETWRRYSLMKYTEEETYEYLLLIMKIPIRKQRFQRWLKRTEVYNKAQVAINSGAKSFHINYFGNLSDFVHKELTKNNHDKS